MDFRTKNSWHWLSTSRVPATPLFRELLALPWGSPQEKWTLICPSLHKGGQTQKICVSCPVAQLRGGTADTAQQVDGGPTCMWFFQAASSGGGAKRTGSVNTAGSQQTRSDEKGPPSSCTCENRNTWNISQSRARRPWAGHSRRRRGDVPCSGGTWAGAVGSSPRSPRKPASDQDSISTATGKSTDYGTQDA